MPDREARRVHHDEHVLEAAVLLAHEVADRAVLVAVGHDGGRARVDAELVLDRHAVHVVALARRAVRLHQELRHDEERDALHAFGRVGRAREHEVDDVLGQVVLAVGDEDLLAEDPVVVALAHGVRLLTSARSEPACGSVRFMVPVQVPSTIFGRYVRLLLVGAAQQQRLDRPVGEHRAEREGQVRRLPHLHHRRGDKLRQALPAEFGRELQRVPAAFDELLVGLLEALRRRDLAVLPGRAFLVAGPVERRQHFGGELRALVQDLLDQVRRGLARSPAASRSRRGRPARSARTACRAAGRRSRSSSAPIQGWRAAVHPSSFASSGTIWNRSPTMP